ncbi:HAD family hydrolase [Coralloluteibacterium thermophilus]|uniref:HAD family hydrolase n=1 Tax=Coralloluteibacterium thermophilum TaxID=2707049 RepID=A0ABV9NHI0_9GAMM
MSAPTATAANPAALRRCRHWVFDMDGTLTVAVHDFALIRRELGVPPEADILDHLASLPAGEAAAAHAWLLEHEHRLADGARPAPGAVDLVRTLCGRGATLGILTRNVRPVALRILATLGIADCFDPGAILGRDEAAPKPDPDGLLRLARRWGVAPAAMAMVGDHVYDLDCARAAGAPAILVNACASAWPGRADHAPGDCAGLAALIADAG